MGLIYLDKSVPRLICAGSVDERQLKVNAENGWFAARPSGTEDVYKIYAESFRSQVKWTRAAGPLEAVS